MIAQTTQIAALRHVHESLFVVVGCPDCGAVLVPAVGRLAVFECPDCGYMDVDEGELDDYLSWMGAQHKVRPC